MSKQKIPTSWEVPDGFVLTWHPPFRFPTPQAPDRQIFVYDEDEPFVPADGAGDGGFNPNGSFEDLGDYDGEHPGVYALSIQGEESQDLHSDAIRTYGKKVTS